MNISYDKGNKAVYTLLLWFHLVGN